MITTGLCLTIDVPSRSRQSCGSQIVPESACGRDLVEVASCHGTGAPDLGPRRRAAAETPISEACDIAQRLRMLCLGGSSLPGAVMNVLGSAARCCPGGPCWSARLRRAWPRPVLAVQGFLASGAPQPNWSCQAGHRTGPSRMPRRTRPHSLPLMAGTPPRSTVSWLPTPSAGRRRAVRARRGSGPQAGRSGTGRPVP